MKSPLLQSLVHRAASAQGTINEIFVRTLVHEFDSCLSQLGTAQQTGDKSQIVGAWARIKRNKALSKFSWLATNKANLWPKTIAELEAIAGKIILGVPSGKPAVVHAIRKAGFGNSFKLIGAIKHTPPEYRTIISFGPEKRATNWLTYTFLKKLHPASTNNYLQTGRGTELLSDHIKNQIEAGYCWVVLFDVKDFYSSVQGTKWLIDNLKMPGKLVLEEVVTSANTTLTMDYSPICISKDQFLKAARLGLAQGLATSLIAGGIVYEDVLKTLFPCGRYFFYGDDGIVFATSKSEAASIANALCGAFQSHPAGPFLLKRNEIRHVQQGFDFVKYRYRQKFNGTIHRTPTINSFHRYEQRVAEIFCKYLDPAIQMEKINDYTANWLKAFSHWQPNEISLEYLELNKLNGIILGEEKLVSLKKKVPPTPIK